jgi:glycosyltransferase involved in cell wall biosynthesis
MNVLVLAALSEATGNATTAKRIARHLEAAHRVELVDSVQADGRWLRPLVAEGRFDCAVGVHALLAGPALRASTLPYALVFGGTDLYEPTHHLQRNQMDHAVANSTRLVAFSAENRDRAEALWPTVRGRVQLIPQAVDTERRAAGFSLKRSLGLRAEDAIVLLPASLRSVKDPLFALQAFGRWHRRQPRVHLVVVGAPLEPEYAQRALAEIARTPGAIYVPALPRDQFLAAVAEADFVLNTSDSEGMCGALLEAMQLQTPILARRNAGNSSLIAGGRTGLLFDTPAGLLNWLDALLASPRLGDELCTAALSYVTRYHDVACEQANYLRLVDDLAFRSLHVSRQLGVTQYEHRMSA